MSLNLDAIKARCDAMASDISYFTDCDHPTHPGPAKLDELRDRWAYEMGWTS